MQKPSVGRIVHYYEPKSHRVVFGEEDRTLSSDAEPLAAIVTATTGTHGGNHECVLGCSGPTMYANLNVFAGSESFFVPGAAFSETPKAGHWSWPPFVPPAKEGK